MLDFGIGVGVGFQGRDRGRVSELGSELSFRIGVDVGFR